ncbi:putative glycolipid-binding domain-containing protein [Glycomyces scopariae]
MWRAVEWPGSEDLDLSADGTGVVADGLVVAAVDGQAVRMAYRIECDPDWRTRSVRIELHGEPPRRLTGDGNGTWFEDGRERADLAGCIDVDIALTPFTNTLPIHRLGLAAGESADLAIVYVQPVPRLDISRAEQRYTRTDTGYRYGSGTFRADLTVDADGLVTAYPGLWTMER